MSNISYRKLRKLLQESMVAHNERMADHDKRMADHEKRMVDLEKENTAYKEARVEAARLHEEAWSKLRQDFERFGISQGEQIEAMFVDLGTKFNSQGFDFPKEADGRVRFFDENKKTLAEVDKLLENGQVMMAVEVKSKLKQDHVDDHIRRLRIISEYNKKHNDSRKVLGAVAGGIVADNVLAYAQNKGLFVIVQNGNSVDIAKLPDNFVPTMW